MIPFMSWLGADGHRDISICIREKEKQEGFGLLSQAHKISPQPLKNPKLPAEKAGT